MNVALNVYVEIVAFVFGNVVNLLSKLTFDSLIQVNLQSHVLLRQLAHVEEELVVVLDIEQFSVMFIVDLFAIVNEDHTA